MKDRHTAEKADAGASQQTQADRNDSDEGGRKERFARALAQSEFGRHYWDDRLESELRQQLRTSKQRWKA